MYINDELTGTVAEVFEDLFVPAVLQEQRWRNRPGRADERWLSGVKVLPPHLAEDPQFPRRFQREARAIAKLEHARILPVYGYGEHEGTTYIAMRYVEAGTLKEYMAEGSLALPEIARIIGQIGSALSYAHRMGIVHRDVKPGNVLIDNQGDTYLTDFGLARMMEGSEQFTATGVTLGTPAYMSPEQGKGLRVDHRSDIYSLGVILYEMVTGRVPFEADTPLAVMLKHISDPLPLPRTLNPNVPESIERIILAAMAREVEDRMQTMGELTSGLETAVRQVAVAEPATVAAVRVKPPARPEPLPAEPLSPPSPSPAPPSWWGQIWGDPRGKILFLGSFAVIATLLFLLVSQSIDRSESEAPAVAADATGVEPKATKVEPTKVDPTKVDPTVQSQAAATDTLIAAEVEPSADEQIPIGLRDTGMGGELTIQGIVRESSGEAAPHVLVDLTVYAAGGGGDVGRLWGGGQYSDESGGYAFINVARTPNGHYEIWLSRREEYGKAYESSGHYLPENDISEDDQWFDMTVHPLTGSAFRGNIQYVDADGETKNFLSRPLGSDNHIELERGSPGDDHEYTIGSQHILYNNSELYIPSLAGGTYYLRVHYIQSDGAARNCVTPAFEIPPGETMMYGFFIQDEDCSE